MVDRDRDATMGRTMQNRHTTIAEDRLGARKSGRFLARATRHGSRNGPAHAWNLPRRRRAHCAPDVQIGTIPVSRPAARASNDAVPEYVEPGAKRRPMPLGVGHSRILVVADDPGLLASLEEVAEGQLIELVRASAADALDKALASFPDAAVLELSATSTRASLSYSRSIRKRQSRR